MAQKSCLSLNMMLRDKRFQTLQEWYPKTNPVLLKIRLERFRNEMDSQEEMDDWYPNDEFRAAFTSFMQRVVREDKLEKARKSLRNGNRFKNFNAILSIYSRGQLRDAIDRVVSDFKYALQHGVEANPGKNLKTVVKRLGGFKHIMDVIFDNYANSEADALYDEIAGDASSMSEGEKAQLREYAKRLALELNTMAQFKEHLIARAAGKISEQTGIEADYDGLIADWKEASDNVLLDNNNEENDDEQGKKDDGETKGASYVDVRLKRVTQTLSADAKRIISDIPMLDENGKPVTTIFGKQRTMDYAQVAYPLYRTVMHANPLNFMDKILEASRQYPWMKYLYDKLNGKGAEKWRMRAIIYTNFKKAQNRYHTIYTTGKGNNRAYATGLVNSVAKGSTVVRHMVNNMIGGIPLGSKHAIYNVNGKIKSDLDYKAVQDDIQIILQAVEGVQMTEGGKPVDKYGADNGKREAYWGMTGEDSVQEFIRLHRDMIDRIVDYARGVGLDIYREDLERMAMIPMPERSEYSLYHNRLSALLSGINSIYGQARSGNYEDADTLSTVIAKAAKKINFSIARALYDEVEDRALVNGKSVSALQGVNVIHQVADILSNAEELDPTTYRAELRSRFGQYEGFSYRGRYVGWLAELDANPSIARQIEIINLLNYNNVEYAKLNDGQRKLAPFILWRKNDKSVYELPIQADYEHSYEFMRFVNSDGKGMIETSVAANPEQEKLYGSTRVPLYWRNEDGSEIWNTDAPIVDAFVDEVLAELERIEAIEARSDTPHKVLSTYETEGKRFSIFPTFNTNGFREEYYKEESPSKRDEYVRKLVCEQLQKIVDADIAKLEDSDIRTNPYAELFSKGKLTATGRGDFQDFSLNYYYARIQMDRLFTGGFSHFTSTTEYEKRCAFLHAPHTAMYTEGEPLFRNVVVIDDDVTASDFIEQETQFAEQAYQNGWITLADKEAMIASYNKIKSTDGQGLVTMDAYIRTQRELGEWDDKVQGAALERIRKGKPKAGDLEMFFGGTTKLVGAGFQHISAVGEGQKPVRNPFFHKYSEIPLLGAEFGKYSIQGQSEFYRGLSMAIEQLKESDIDVDLFLFKSGSKVGTPTPLFPLLVKDGVRVYDTAEKIRDYLVGEITANPSVYVQHMPMEAYGKAANLPQFKEDERITTSAQAVKAVFTDIEPEDECKFGGMTRKAVEARDMHDRIETAEIIDAFEEVSALIGNKKELERIFQKELASKSYSSEETMYALSLLENGEFAAHLFTPTFAKDIQSMLFSLISQRMTRKASRGAHLAQFTSVGIDVSSAPWKESQLDKKDLLGLHFKGKGDDIQFLGIGSYTPIYDSKFEIFADENGAITPKRLRELVADGIIPQEALYFEAYRTPSDHTHSVLPMVCDGMSAKVAGGKIAVSKEAMNMTGHDFDGDELNCHFPELELIWDEEKLKEIYAKALKAQLEDELEILKKGMTDEDFIKAIKKNDAKNRITHALDKAGIKWKDAVRIGVVQYNFNESPLEQSAAARHNGKLTLRRAVLTSKKGATRLFLPGSNDKTTIYAKALYIHRQLGSGQIHAENIYRIADSENIHGLDLSDAVHAFKSLSMLKIDEINKLFDALNGNSNPFSYSYAVDAYKRVIGGASLIDVFALYSGASQMLQRANLYYKEVETKQGYRMHVGFFGNRIGKLYAIRNNEKNDVNPEGLLASLLMSRMVQSAVDNNKNPILGILNQSQQLSSMMNFLCAAGLSEKQIHLVFNQPAIVELIDRMARRGSKGLVAEAKQLIWDIDNNFRAEGTKSLNQKTYLALSDVENTGESTYIEGAALGFNQLGEASLSVKQLQCNLLRTFIHLNSAAEDLTEVVRTTRPESSTGTVGPTVSATAVKEERLNKLRRKDSLNRCRIGNVAPLIDPLLGLSEDREALYDELRQRPVARVAALNSLMYDNVMGWIKAYMPQARKSWIDLAVGLAERYGYRSLQEGIVRQILSDMLTWKILSNQPFIGDIEALRKDLLEELPKRVRALNKEIKTARGVIRNGGVPTNDMAASLVDNAFLKKIVAQKDRISFRPGGVVTTELRDLFSAGWGELAESKYPEIRQLATDLYEYNLLTNGMRFGMYEFAHLAPMSVMYAVPGLRDALDDVLTSDFPKGDVQTKNFVRQYYMNHWQDDKLVPLYDESELPNGLREQMGLRTIDTRDYEHKADVPQTVPLKQIKHRFYIAVKKTTPDSKKKDTVLYRLTVNENGTVAMQPVSKLGKKGKHGQISVHYNPDVSPNYFNLKEQVQGEDYIPDNGEPDYGQDPFGDFSLRTAKVEERSDPFVLPSRVQKTVETSDDRPDPFSGLRGPKEMAESVEAHKQLRKAAEEADAKNNIPDDAEPEDYSAYSTEDYEDPDAFRQIDDFYSEYDDSDDEQDEDDDEDESDYGEDPGQEDAYYDGSRELFYIGQRDGSDVRIFTEPLKPWSVRRARQQRAYIRLRKAIERILESKGISIGVLDEMEARMDGLYGVTDFKKIQVITEGMKELIRLSNGVGGLIALPEEFGHLALAMLGNNHPLVNRLCTVLETNENARREAFEGQFDEYEQLYKEDQHKLTFEAAGKLVAKALIREQEIQDSWVRRLVHRIVDAIKNVLRSIGIRRIEDAQYDAEQVAGELARNLLSGRLVDEMDLANVTETGTYYKKVKQDISDWEDVVSKLLKVEERRLKILSGRLAYHKNKASDASMVAVKKEVEELKDAIKKHKTEEAIISYFGYATEFLNSTNETMKKLADGGYGANAVCKRLDIIRDTIDGFRLTIKHINDAIASGELTSSKNMKQAISNVTQLCAEMSTDANNLGMQYFQEMMRGFYGDSGVEVSIGRDKGRRISIERMTTEAPRDVSLFSRWVHSMGNCRDLVLKAIDGIVRAEKQKARNDTLTIKARVDVAFEKLYKATGSKDQRFMFEYKVGEDGVKHKTGQYISEQDSKKLSPAQKEFYDAIMQIKKELDKMLPESLADNRKIVMMRKLAMQKASESKDVKEKGKYIWEALRNTILDTSDNIDFDHQEVEVNFRGNRVDRLPVLYTKKGKGESYDDMVDDVATSILAYGAMAYEYGHMNSIIGQLENAKYMASQRRVMQHTGRRLQRETVSDKDVTFHEAFTVEQAKTNLQKVLNDYFVMHVYNHIRADEGTIGRTRVSKGKVVQAANALTSMSQLGFNITQRIANLSIGEAQIIIQTAGKGHFKMKDVLWATKEYMRQTADRLLDTGKLSSDNYLSLFSEKFDIRQDNGRVYKERKYQKGWLSRVFNGNLMYAGLTAGEDVLACTTAMALAKNFKLLNAAGKEDNIWNAYEVKYLDEVNKTGAYLQLKKGWKNLDGNDFTAEDERRFMNLSAGVNFDLQGIYNLDDKSAMQQYAFGSAVMMYRKWMAPALKLRYGAAQYDTMRGQWEEGYYRTSFRYVCDSIMDIIREGEGIAASFQANWEKLTPYEKTNIQRAIREFSILTGAIGSIALLEKLPPDDNKDDGSMLDWATSMSIYQLYRLRNELGAMAPTPLLPQEAMKILQTPFAALSLLKNALEVWRLFVPSNYTTTVKSGAYKGHSKAYQYFWNMPVLSMRKQLHHFIDPSPMIQYYENNVVM